MILCQSNLLPLWQNVSKKNSTNFFLSRIYRQYSCINQLNSSIEILIRGFIFVKQCITRLPENFILDKSISNIKSRRLVVIELKRRSLSIKSHQIWSQSIVNKSQRKKNSFLKLNFNAGFSLLKLISTRTVIKGWRHRRIFSIMRHDDLWIATYERLKKNITYIDFDIDKKIINSVSKKIIFNLKSKLLERGSFWLTVKDLKNSKTDCEVYNLKMFVLQNYIIQEILRLVFEAIYQPLYLNLFHGFLSKQSVFTLLKEMHRNFIKFTWIVHGSVRYLLDRINSEIFIQILKYHVNDIKFIKFIEFGLKSGILLSNRKIKEFNVKVLVKEICLPILLNIYLYRLDLFVFEKKKHFEGKDVKNIQEEYILLNTQKNSAFYIKYSGIYNIDPLCLISSELYYIRYLDHFFIGFNGSFLETKTIFTEIESMLDIKLKVKVHFKGVIFCFCKKYLSFFGYLIRRRLIKMRHVINKRLIPFKREIIEFFVDKKKILKRLSDLGFSKFGRYSILYFKYLYQTQKFINQETTNMLFGLNSYYMFASNRKKSILFFSYIIRFSIARLFITKYKLSSIRKVFIKKGRYFDCTYIIIKAINIGLTTSKE